MKVLVDSKYREDTDQDTITNYTYILKHPIKNVSRISLLESIFPNSLYIISSSLSTNSFSFTDDTPETKTITIPSGNYNGTDLASEITDAINSTMTDSDWTVSYSSATNKFTTTKTNGDTWSYNAMGANMAGILGLPLTGSGDQTTNYEHTNMIDLSFPRYLYLDVFTHHSSNSEIATNSGSSHSFLIKMEENPYELENTKSLVDFQQIELNSNNDVTHLEIRITLPTQDGSTIYPDFNGVDHQIFLEFD